MSRKDGGSGKEILRALSMLTQLGLTMAACVLLGFFGGRYLDRLLGTSPWLLLSGCVIGAAAAFKALYDMAIKRWL